MIKKLIPLFLALAAMFCIVPMRGDTSTDLLYDTGEAFLNPDIFNGIPDTALCTLTILRGNVENVLINDYSCKIAAETHQSIQFILIRNVIENEKVDQNTGF